MGKPDDIDHIYPKSSGGTDAKINMQRLSVSANKGKDNKTKGKIGDSWKFAIVKQTKGDTVFGVMYIRHNQWSENEWKKVIPVG